MLHADELKDVRVLVVDDNATAREIMSTMARNFDLKADVADNGEQALRLISSADQENRAYNLTR